jgi:hypothetical protein
MSDDQTNMTTVKEKGSSASALVDDLNAGASGQYGPYNGRMTKGHYTGDAFWGDGTSGEGFVEYARSRGFKRVTTHQGDSDSGYDFYYTMQAPDGSTVTYQEGDIYLEPPTTAAKTAPVQAAVTPSDNDIAFENAQVESVSVEAPTAKDDDFLAGQDTAVDRILAQEPVPLDEAGQSRARGPSRSR